jgi:regulator of replication initiation timing
MSEGKSLNLCPNCAKLRLQITFLKAENRRLKAENRQLKKKLVAIRDYAEKVENAANAILSRRSGVPRGKWSFARGADRTADGVLKRC